MNDPERALLDQSLAAMAGCVRRFERSHVKLARLFPLRSDQLASLSAVQEEAIDAFLKGFEQLVTTIQEQVFKGIMLVEAERIHALSRRDVTELMERLRAISSAAEFRTAAILRNRLSHLYPDDPDRQVAILNAALDHTGYLLATAHQLGAFAARRP